MKKIDAFTNQYSLSKTLCFSLTPVGKTEENFNAKLLLESDENRSKEYEKVKGYIDRYHRFYIEKILSKTVLEGVNEYAELYYKINKNDNDNKAMEKAEIAMRKYIAKALTSNSVYKKIFGQEMIKELLPDFLSEEEMFSVKMFQNFFTYFNGFNENRKNMYSSEPQTTAIAYRCINENLPKFLDNSGNYKKIISVIPSAIEQLNQDFCGVYGVTATDVFSVDYFTFVLSQSGIDKYNGIIGGYVCSDGTKIKGINEYINLYNQQIAKKDKSKRLPYLKPLYKQILTESNTVSFVPEKFESDTELLDKVNTFYINIIDETITEIEKIFADFESYDSNGIFIRSGLAITDTAKAVFGNWNAVSEAWFRKYSVAHPMKSGANEEKYYDSMKKEYSKIKSFSILEVQELGSVSSEKEVSVVQYYKDSVLGKIHSIRDAYNNSITLLTTDYESANDKKLCRNEAAIELIKALLDSIKELEHILKKLLGTGKEENKDSVFYGEFLPLYDKLSETDYLYNKVRNYVTQKPYSKDKIKLTFDNPQLLGGWDRNKERDYRTVLLIKEGKYYLAIMDKTSNKIFLDPPFDEGESYYEKVEYKLLPGPNKMLPKVFFAASNLEYFAPSKEVLEIRQKETFKKGDNFNLNDCHQFIDFFKSSINQHPDWSQFGFKFTPTDNYNDISEFYNEVKEQGYSIKRKKISCKYIENLVDSGQLYLFQIYNKDFSEYSHGAKNLHTLYFEMLFNEKNLSDVVYQLNGGAEMFYRKASIKSQEKTVHPANQPIKNKNQLNQKTESIFEYDITKDKRFTERQFSLHIPITLNFKAKGQEYINNDVRRAIKNSESYIIGIDRGERNLLYICVINEKGEIVEQKSLNAIISDKGYTVDYHKLLDQKEKSRDLARKSWGTVENIKELKEGYLSQAVHEICKMVVKYDAIIAMEDLNFGFKNGRFKVEKQVYQKFENMLTSKLNYLVDKRLSPEEKGGLLNAYQLTNKVNGVNRGKQNGIIFYVPAWMTSKIDPVTGFVNLLNTKYTNVADAKAFVEKIDSIRYNKAEDIFEFDIDYSKFKNGALSYQKEWTICSNEERIITFRNPEKNNEWDCKKVVLTDEFKQLFNRFDVNYNSDLKENILEQSSKEFFETFLRNLSYVLQMRNSVVGSDIDYLISPVKDSCGKFFDSRNADMNLPENADANGAFNIARKALWATKILKQTADDNIKDVNLSIKNADWLEFAQK